MINFIKSEFLLLTTLNYGTFYLRALMHTDGNIQYANYQNQTQMSDYLTAQGHKEIISDIF